MTLNGKVIELPRLLDTIVEEVQRATISDWPRLVEERARKFPHLADALRRQIDIMRALEAEHQFDLQPGMRLGPYVLTRSLGRGATSKVWEASHCDLGHRVALKIFDPKIVDDDHELWHRTLLEGRAFKHLETFPREGEDQNPSQFIVRVHEVGHGSCLHYIAMEFCREIHEGEEQTAVDAAEHKPATLAQALKWSEQIARGIALAHRAGVFHRDLKPQNVLVFPSGTTVKVTDLGLIQTCLLRPRDPASAPPGESTAFQEDRENGLWIAGTYIYMAPEAARGTAYRLDTSKREHLQLLVGIDIYGLGAILYSFLTAKAPHERHSSAAWADFLRHIQQAAPPSLQSTRVRRQGGFRVPRRVHAVLQKCMANNAVDRYQAAQEVAEDLYRLRMYLPTSLERGIWHRLILWIRRNPRQVTFVLAQCLVYLLGSLLILDLRQEITRLGDKAKHLRPPGEHVESKDEKPIGELAAWDPEAVRVNAVSETPPAAGDKVDGPGPKPQKPRRKGAGQRRPSPPKGAGERDPYALSGQPLNNDVDMIKEQVPAAETAKARATEARLTKQLERVHSLVVHITTGSDDYGGTDDRVTLHLAGKAFPLPNPGGDSFERKITQRFELATEGLSLRDFVGEVRVAKSQDGTRGGWSLAGLRIEVNGVAIYEPYIGEWLENDHLEWTGSLPRNTARRFGLE